jgi:hypothetical protein
MVDQSQGRSTDPCLGVAVSHGFRGTDLGNDSILTLSANPWQQGHGPLQLSAAGEHCLMAGRVSTRRASGLILERLSTGAFGPQVTSRLLQSRQQCRSRDQVIFH